MKTYEEGLRAGFELARDNAEIGEHDGWVRTAPFLEWDRAQRELETAVAAARQDHQQFLEIAKELLEELDGFFESKVSTAGLDIKVAFEKALLELREHRKGIDTDWTYAHEVAVELAALTGEVCSALGQGTDPSRLIANVQLRRTLLTAVLGTVQ